MKATNETTPEVFSHLAFIYYKRLATDAGFLKDFRVMRDPNSTKVIISGESVKTGTMFIGSLDAEGLTTIDNDVCELIKRLRRAARDEAE